MSADRTEIKLDEERNPDRKVTSSVGEHWNSRVIVASLKKSSKRRMPTTFLSEIPIPGILACALHFGLQLGRYQRFGLGAYQDVFQLRNPRSRIFGQSPVLALAQHGTPVLPQLVFLGQHQFFGHGERVVSRQQHHVEREINRQSEGQPDERPTVPFAQFDLHWAASILARIVKRSLPDESRTRAEVNSTSANNGLSSINRCSSDGVSEKPIIVITPG